MPKAISNTSPILYLYRVKAINWLPKLFDEVWTPEAVKNELLAGRTAGYDVPDPAAYPWLTIANPISTPAKSQGLVDKIEPYITNLSNSGMWASAEVKERILKLAGE